MLTPEYGEELQCAVNCYVGIIKGSSEDFSDAIDIYGPIGEWDVPRLTDMNNLFRDMVDIRHLEVGGVKRGGHDQHVLLHPVTQSYNGDISKWDVSSIQYDGHARCVFQRKSVFY